MNPKLVKESEWVKYSVWTYENVSVMA